MKTNKRDITVAACGAFSVIVLAINWLVPVNAQTPGQQQAPVDLGSVSMHKQAAVTNLQDFIQGADQMAGEISTLRKENARLKDELAKAKAPVAPR